MNLYFSPLLLLISFATTSYSQDFINCNKEYLITRLKDNGFENNPEAHYYLKDSTNQVIALFNEFRYSRIEYHITNNTCDSISCVSSCDQCFDGTLNSILSNKKRKWKTSSKNEFTSLKNSKKVIENNEEKYKVLKLKITSSKTTGSLSFLIYNNWINQSEYKRLKKVKKYKETYQSY